MSVETLNLKTVEAYRAFPIQELTEREYYQRCIEILTNIKQRHNLSDLSSSTLIHDEGKDISVLNIKTVVFEVIFFTLLHPKIFFRAFRGVESLKTHLIDIIRILARESDTHSKYVRLSSYLESQGVPTSTIENFVDNICTFQLAGDFRLISDNLQSHTNIELRGNDYIPTIITTKFSNPFQYMKMMRDA